MIRYLATGLLVVLAVSECSFAGTNGSGVSVDGTRACEAATPAPAAVVAFEHVNVVPMDLERVLDDQTVVVRDGHIVAMGPAADVTVPEEAQRIDGAGKYLMPGLADMHVHIFDDRDLLLFVANGVTTVRNMWGSPDDLARRQKVADGEILGPTYFTTGPGLDGNPSYWSTAVMPATPEEARQAVADQKAAGYDFLKIYSRLSPEIYDAILAAAKEYDIRAVGHLPIAVDLDHALHSGQVSIAHLGGIAQAARADDNPPDARLWGARLDPQKLAAVAHRIKDSGVWLGPTITVIGRSLDEVEAIQASDPFRYISPTLREWFTDKRTFPPPGDRSAVIQNLERAVKAMSDAGVPMLLGTDTGVRVVLPGFSLHQELRYVQDAGLSPFRALRMGTVDAATFLADPDQPGVVRVGARADLLLLDANPLDDVANTDRRAGVMVRGSWYPQAALDRMMQQQAACFAQQ